VLETERRITIVQICDAVGGIEIKGASDTVWRRSSLSDAVLDVAELVDEAAGDAGVGVDAAVAEEGPVTAGVFE
jgi:hypothetical protein